MKYSLPALTITAFLLSGSAVFAAPTATDVAAQTATGTLAAPTVPSPARKRQPAPPRIPTP